MTSFLGSPFSSYLKGLLFFSVLLFSQILPGDDIVWNQAMLLDRVKEYQPKERLFIKDKLIFGYHISEERLSQLPQEIRDRLGKVDQTIYSDEMLCGHKDSFIALQMKDEEYDFYVIDHAHFQDCYQKIPLEIACQDEENKQLIEDLSKIPAIASLIEAKNGKIWGLLKATQMKMVKMSEMGFLDQDTVRIRTPWATQIKPAQLDAYLAFDAVNSIYYLINEDSKGYPINYIPLSAL